MRAGLILHPLAERELDDAAGYYEAVSTGLAGRFLAEVDAFAGKILAHPLRFSIRIADVRRANLKTFPYHLNYLLHGDSIAVVAVSHNRQHPFYWSERLKNREWLD